MTIKRLKANYYQQFDADYRLDVPAEAFGGWRSTEIDLSLEHTGLVSMHAWKFDSAEQYPGLYRSIDYIERARSLVTTVYPPVLEAARRAGLQVLHVVGCGDSYYQSLPGYLSTVELAGQTPAPPEGAICDPSVAKLKELQQKLAWPGERNVDDCNAGHSAVTFPGPAEPAAGEPIAENAHQLNEVCRARGISHLIYMGVAINWCLLMSPGGMVDMRRLGYVCSAVRQATTAVENRETARKELCKEIALWRVGLAFGFVFDADDLVAGLNS